MPCTILYRTVFINVPTTYVRNYVYRIYFHLVSRIFDLNMRVINKCYFRKDVKNKKNSELPTRM